MPRLIHRLCEAEKKHHDMDLIVDDVVGRSEVLMYDGQGLTMDL